MRYVFTLISVFCMIVAGNYSQAQCSPNTIYTAPGIYPDTMPEGTVSVPYSEDITFVLPTDTSGFDFTNFEIVSISLPVGLNWVCNNNANGCNYNPQVNQYGCVNVSGTPLLAGDYNVTVSVMATLEVLGTFPTTFDVFMRVNPAEVVTTNDGFSMSGFSGCSPITVEFTNNNPGLLAYSWDFGNGNTSTLENPAPQVYTTPGEYEVTYKAWDNLTTVDVYTLTGLTINSMSGYGEGFPSYEAADAFYVLLQNGTVVATSSIITDTDPPVSWPASTLLDPALTYTIEIWESDAAEPLLGGEDFIGTHTLNIGGCNGCAAGTANISYTITHQQILPVPLVISVDTIEVFGNPGQPNIYFDSVNHTLHTDSIAYDLQWYLAGSPISGANSASLVIDESGMYSLIAISGGGCVAFSDTIQAVVCNENFVPGITQAGPEIEVENPGGYEVQWYLNGEAIPNAVSNTLPISQGGEYTAVLTSPLGCEITSESYISTIGIAEKEIKPFIVYPNPSNGMFYIKMSSDAAFSVEVRDMAGRTVATSENESSIDLSAYGKGVYLLQIKTNGGGGKYYTERLIVK